MHFAPGPTIPAGSSTHGSLQSSGAFRPQPERRSPEPKIGSGSRSQTHYVASTWRLATAALARVTGFWALTTATDDCGDNVEQLSKHLSEPDPEAPEWEWPEHVLPFCYWGCQVYSCVVPDGPVVELDGYDWHDAGIPLIEWLSRWADGRFLSGS